MTVNASNAAYYAQQSYISNGGTALNGWVKLTTSDEQNISGHGYFGVAFVKVVEGVAVDVVIAHRGTEPTDISDLITDAGLALQLPNIAQQNDAAAFLNAARSAYNNEGYNSINPFDDITTNVGHSLGGWLSVRTANSMGSNGKAITFDAPASGLSSTSAAVTHYLNPPNFINGAGGDHVGTVYQLESDRTFSSETEGPSLGNIIAGFVDAIIQLPVGIAGFINLFTAGVAEPLTKIASGPAAALQTISEHDLDNIIAHLNTAELSSTDIDPMEYYFVGTFSDTGVVGGKVREIWDAGFNEINNISLNQLAQQFVSYVHSNNFSYMNPVNNIAIGTEIGDQLIATSTTGLIDGGDGDDIIYLQAHNTFIDGGNGFDMLDYSLLEGEDFVNVDVGAGQTYLNIPEGEEQGSPKDIFDHIEAVTGTDNGDIVLGDNVANFIDGGAGDDTLEGGSGNDTIVGGFDNDEIYGDNGDDSILGIAGENEIYGGAGNDSIYGGVNNDYIGGEDGNDVILGNDGDDAIWGDDGDDTLIGGAGNDNIDGSTGTDHIFGDEGDDLLYAPSGTNFFYGGADNDYIIGGTGNDTYIYQSSDFGRDTIFDDDGALLIDGTIVGQDANSTDGYAEVIFVGSIFNVEYGSVNAFNLHHNDLDFLLFKSTIDNTDLIISDYTFTNNIEIDDFENGTFGLFLDQPPVAVDDIAYIGSNGYASVNVLSNDSDLEDNVLTLENVEIDNIIHGSIVGFSNDGNITFKPTGDTGSFSYRFADSQGQLSNWATVTIDGTAPNTAPVAVNDTVRVNINDYIDINILANDYDAEDVTLSPSNVSLPEEPFYTNRGGLVDYNSDTGVVRYTPNQFSIGQDSFTYTVTDSEGLVSNKAVVTINIGDNHIPIAGDDYATAHTGESIEINVLANDYDLEDQGIAHDTFHIASGVATGNSISYDSDSGIVTYTSRLGFHGLDSFTYTVTDSEGARSNVATVTINVGAGDNIVDGTAASNNITSSYVDADGDSVSDGDDIIIGYAGNDTLHGYDGDDLYIFNAGDGLDSIYHDDSGNDSISVDGEFYLNIANSDLRIYYNVQEDGSYDLVTVNDNFSGYQVETVNGVDVTGGLEITDRPGLNNSLRGTDFEDTITGGDGNDSLYGYDGDDLYIFNAGDGLDTIYETGGNDSIEVSGEVYLNKFNSDLQIYYNVQEDGSYDRVIVQSHFNGYQVENLNGTNLTGGLEITDRPGLNNSLRGTDFEDTITGGDGNDSLYGYDGDDLYIFNAGDGNDTISYETGGNDSIEVSGEVYLNNNGGSLYVYYGGEQGSYDRITIYDQNTGVAKIETINGMNVTGGLIITDRLGYNSGLQGTDFEDTITGGDGNDELRGYGGDDLYIFNAGDGYDVIYDTLGSNALSLGAGAVLEQNGNDLRVYYGYDDGEDFIITDRLIVDDYYSSGAW